VLGFQRPGTPLGVVYNVMVAGWYLLGGWLIYRGWKPKVEKRPVEKGEGSL
jgi:hypothetical protein